MMDIISRIYQRMPLVKEKQQIREIVGHKRSMDTQILHTLLAQFERDLLKEDKYSTPKNLNNYEAQVFSQFGEDGIIAEIFRRIGVSSKSFVEIGVGDGLENNTIFLLFQDWQGYWIDGNDEYIESIKSTFKKPIDEGRLQVIKSFVTAENIRDSFQEAHIPTEIDLLSIDIDRNTYHIWAALPHIKPRVVVVEYNSIIPADVDWKVNYVADRSWNGTAYFGASLKAFENLGRDLGYSLVGCNLSGQNAFFVRNDLCADKFLEPYTSETHYEKPRYFLYRRNNHPHPACFDDNDNT